MIRMYNRRVVREWKPTQTTPHSQKAECNNNQRKNKMTTILSNTDTLANDLWATEGIDYKNDSVASAPADEILYEGYTNVVADSNVIVYINGDKTMTVQGIVGNPVDEDGDATDAEHTLDYTWSVTIDDEVLDIDGCGTEDELRAAIRKFMA